MLAVLLFALSLAQAQELSARIVGDRDSPAFLLGNPCGVDSSKRVAARMVAEAVDPSDVLYGPFHSEPFRCEAGACDLAIVSERGMLSVQFGIIILGDRGRYYQGVLPETTMQGGAVCHGAVVRSVPVKTSLPVESVLVFIASVQFADGSRWQVDQPAHFASVVTKEWQRRVRAKE